MGNTKRLPDHTDDEISVQFPNLERSTYEITSPEDTRYNCIAYTAGDDQRWWEPIAFPSPGYYWPEGADRGAGLNALVSCFEKCGFEVCDNGAREEAYTKIVLYADEYGSWTHAARQTKGGEWTSKLGGSVDIRHRTPECVSGPAYGEAQVFMRKKA